MNRNDVTIPTISWARNEEEESLLQASLQQLNGLRIPIYLTDGGSGPSFIEFLNSLSQVTLLKAEGKGVFAQARKSIGEAYRSGAPFIFYTEPDKGSFFQQSLPHLLQTVQPNEQTGIVLASRSAEGYATFPPFQQMTETTINNCCAEVTGYAVDYTYGPFLFNRVLAPYLERVQEDIGWGWRPYVFILAKRLGLNIESVAGPYACPPDQREDSPGERIYRMKQLTQNLQGITMAATMPM